MQITWNVTPEKIISEPHAEVTVHWNHLKKITVCPEHLFVHFGILGRAYLPKQCIPEADCQAFRDHLIQG